MTLEELEKKITDINNQIAGLEAKYKKETCPACRSRQRTQIKAFKIELKKLENDRKNKTF